MRYRLITLALCAAGLGTVAAADDYIAFRSPTGNIHCAIMTGDWASARCDMDQLTPSYRNRPYDCEQDWGDAFEVGARGGGYLPCHGDTVSDPSAFMLGYGRSVSLGPFTCTSRKTGMTCTNAQGHGFQISKARQKLF